MKAPLTVAASMGVQSTAILAGFHLRGIRPDVITFADTGGERPETYAYVPVLQAWLASVGFPALAVVQNDGKYRTLENNCLAKKMLPSLAYGWRACSEKYKHRPQHKYMRRHCPITMNWWMGREPATGERRRVVRCIGYDINERHRAERVTSDAWYLYEYPLITWGWDREDCRFALETVGLPIPAKTACYFCPASTLPEIRDLAANHPDLFARALAIEANAELKTVKGLGRRFAWASLPVAQAEAPGMECVCIGETPEDDKIDDQDDDEDSSSAEKRPMKS